MIPIAIFILIWLVLVAVFMVISIFSILQMLRFGISGNVTKWTVIGFVTLSLLIIIGTLIFLSQVDMQSGLDINSFLESIFPV